MPLAGRVADAMLQSLGDGKIVPAEIMADRYFLYRIPEHLESYIDFGERIKDEGQSAKLPYERPDFRTVFPDGRFFIEKRGSMYLVANAAKGGVIKIFRADTGEQLLSDGGIIGATSQGRVLTSQWIDPSYTFTPKEHGFVVSGSLHCVPANKIFTPMTMILFRIFLLVFGWHTGMAYRIKGFIRRILMLKSGVSGVRFSRDVAFAGSALRIVDTITIADETAFSRLQIGDTFFVRYVPQSRYFQSEELCVHGHCCTSAQIAALNRERTLRCERVIDDRLAPSTKAQACCFR
ncbi:hypothetical protein HY464_02390 [Candidatus Peregrinibacteria bacterium]|nr:hypothetical protein [Candidatus Peregrinibacteria bacterium]